MNFELISINGLHSLQSCARLVLRPAIAKNNVQKDQSEDTAAAGTF